MKWSEVIMVRRTGNSPKMCSTILQDLMDDVVRNAGHEHIRVFRRENLETDICIVLFHNREKKSTGGSSLALRIVAAFEEAGQVYHTVWNEIEK